MSKSDASDMSRINLIDDPDTIVSKVKKAKTDPEPLPSEAAGLDGRAEAKNLVGIFSALSNESVDSVLARFGGQGFGAFKPALAELMVETLKPISERFNALRQDTAALDAILVKGAERARVLAAPTLDRAYTALGLSR
jgi:tryptophanyl-tRNA synthetase